MYDPGIFTAEQRERFGALYATGLPIRAIAREMGIGESTLRKWRDKALRAHGAYRKPSAPKEPSEPLPDLELMRAERTAQFIEDSWEIIQQGQRLVHRRLVRALDQEAALDQIIAGLQGADGLTAAEQAALVAKLRELQIQQVRELSTLIGTMYDKASLASGRATQAVTVEAAMDEEDRELLRRVGERLHASDD